MKFKIGDRVKVIKIDKLTIDCIDCPGTIVNISEAENEKLPYEIELDKDSINLYRFSEDELDFLGKREECKNVFTRITPVSGDWEAWYLNGKLIAEGHTVNAWDLIDGIADVFPNEIQTIEISDEKAEIGFSENLSDMLNT